MANLPPHEWNCQNVAAWLKENGFNNYVELFTNHHRIDGKVLLCLTENDFREKPLQMTVLGDIKRISQAIDVLRANWYSNEYQQQNGRPSGLPLVIGSTSADLVYKRLYETRDANGITMNASLRTMHYEERHCNKPPLIEKIERPDTQMSCMIKTMLAAVYCCISLLLTSLVMVIVHDRVPDMKTYPPLPDLFLDNIPFIPWAFEVCEMLACCLGTIWLLVLVFHKRRTILLRRMFSLTGTVFLLRCVTMLITSLSVPGVHLECYGQGSFVFKTHVDMYSKFRQALRIWYGMGMSLRGVRSCGDYMFSGHTTVVTLLNHFVTEYTPDGWHYVHTISWVMNLFSIFFILAGHEHYSIDVFVAFYISSRLFLYYHSMAYHAKSMTAADGRTRIWFPLFWFFESGGHVGRVENEYEVPLPSTETVRRIFCSIRSQLIKFTTLATCSDPKSPDFSPKSPRRTGSGGRTKPKNGPGANENINGGNKKKTSAGNTNAKNGKIKQF